MDLESTEAIMEVKWETNLEEGLRRAEDEGKFVFLDFYNPG